MENLTLTHTLERLQTWIENCQCDLSSDWIEEEDKREMQQQLQNLLIAKEINYKKEFL